MKAQIEHWDDIKIAYEVAKRGTLSAAANALDVHHSTVLRRINALEERLNTRLFHRHARGYKPTEAGQSLLQVATGINEQIDKLAGYIQGSDQQISGSLVITTVTGLSDIIAPWLAEFKQMHPQLKLEIIFDRRKLRLDYGEAHIALRPGAQPTEPDYIAQDIWTLKHSLYASKGYIRKHGLPKDREDLSNHYFISSMPDSPAPFIQWIEHNIPPQNIVLRSSDFYFCNLASLNDVGIFVLPDALASKYPELVRLFSEGKPIPSVSEDDKHSNPNWHSTLWLVTHLLMHRTGRVKAFCDFIKQKFNELN